MLDKLKITAVVSALFQLATVIFDVDLSGIEGAVLQIVEVLVPILAGWLLPERQALINQLSAR